MGLKWCFVLFPFFLLLSLCASETCPPIKIIRYVQHNVCLVKTKGCFGVKLGNCSDVVACENNFVYENGVCPEGLDVTKTWKECSSGLVKVCSKTEDCGDSSRLLLCRRGKCRCQYPLQEYSYSRGRCVGREEAHSNISNKDNYLDFLCSEGTICEASTIVAIITVTMNVSSRLFGILCPFDPFSWVVLAIVIFIVLYIVFGLVVYEIAKFCDDELQQSNSHHTPAALTMDDLERGTTSTLLSCAGESATTPPTPINPKSAEENRSLTVNPRV